MPPNTNIAFLPPTPLSLLRQTISPLPQRCCHRPAASNPQHRPRTTAAVTSPPSPTTTPPSPTPSPATSCGFAALLGPSNSGKSTLLNHLMGQKVAIVSPKVQTTRCRISGIAAFDATQVVFLDTPGIFDATNRLSRAMVRAAWKSARAADIIAVVVDAAEMFHEARRVALEGRLYVPDDLGALLRRVSKFENVVVLANKMDAIPQNNHAFVKTRLEAVLHDCGMTAATVLPISARSGDGVDVFRDVVVRQMPSGPWLYPEHDLTDMPSRLMAAELVREQAFRLLKHELPYQIAVDTTSYRRLKDGSTRITCDVIVASQSQKKIVTGRAGAVVKQLGMKARVEMQELLQGKVHLMLTVKVRPKWKEDQGQYDQWGLDYNA